MLCQVAEDAVDALLLLVRRARQALPLLRARGDRRFRLRRLAPDALDTLALLVGLALEPIALRGRRGDRGRHRAHLAAGALADLRRQALEPLALRRRAPDRVLDGNEIGGLVRGGCRADRHGGLRRAAGRREIERLKVRHSRPP